MDDDARDPGSGETTPHEVAALRRKVRRLAAAAGASLVVVALLAGLLISDRGSGDDDAADPQAGRTPASAERLIASLGDAPVDPTKVQLVSSVSTFDDCDALITDLRRVGAAHVGSRGFGGFYDLAYEVYGKTGTRRNSGVDHSSQESAAMPTAAQDGGGGGDTLGTNVQVAGVDELDFVKAVGPLIYDLDGRGDLRITDAGSLQVVSSLDVTPGPDDDQEFGRTNVSELLVADGRIAVFGSEVEISEPVEGDPSATQAATAYMTVTFVDAADPAAPEITDRVRVEGSLVSARLVAGEIRLVTTATMADLGFVMPTTPRSVPKALEQNRRSVATSDAADWIPDWQREAGDPQPLVPCARVHVPDTFSGVAMTSMVTFPIGSGRFDPLGTSILAPATTLYAGLEKVAISSEVWVDPIDRGRLEFDDWQTAVHEFGFADGAAPGYEGSGIVDGSTVGQFAFGEIGDALAVVTTEGTPWQQDPEVAVDLTVLSPDGDGSLERTSSVDDLAGGEGAVSAVRFLDGRVLVSTGATGREIHVLDVRDPTAPRRAGRVGIPADVGYFHPLPDDRALVVGSRYDQVGEGRDRQDRSWVHVELLDVSDVDAPRLIANWERPWVADEVGGDHHAFTYWPDRQLAMWGLRNTQWQLRDPGPNHALVLGTDGGVDEVAVIEASKPAPVPAPCPTVPITDPELKQMIETDALVLRCADRETREVEWPRYQCYRIDDGTIARFAPGEEEQASFFMCSPAPPPAVARVLVVDGRPVLLTDQTLEALDPTTFRPTAVAYHPTGGR